MNKINYETKFHINLNWDDIRFIQKWLELLVPNQKLCIIGGRPTYETVASGTTRKGRFWHNSNIVHRENCLVDIKHRYPKYLIGKGIDLGCGIEKVTPDCIGVDNADDFKDECDADDFRDISDLTGYADGQFDWVFSSNAIEHITNWKKALDEWVRVLRPGGNIFIYTTWPEKCPILGANGPVTAHLWNPSPSILRNAFEKRGVDVIECDNDVDRWGTFVIVGRKR